MSGSKSGFSVSITAVDAASKQIDAINARIRAMQAPAERLTKSFGKLADNTGITRLSGGMRSLARESFQAFENIGRMVGPLGAITSAASIAGMVKLASSFGDFGNKTDIAARRAGMSVVPFLNLGNAARLAGVSSEAMGAGITSLKDNIFDFAAGRAAPMTIAAFNTLGFSAKELSDNLSTPEKLLPHLADALSAIKDPTQRAKLEMLTLGASGAALDPLLRLGSKALQDLTDKAAALYGVTDKQIAQAVEFHQKTEALTIATEGLGIAIAADLLPVLGPVITQMTQWIEANKSWISADIKSFVERSIPVIGEFATNANDVAKALGGWKTVFEEIATITLAGWVVRIIASLNPLMLMLAAMALTIEKIQAFSKQGLAELPVGSPLWANVPDSEQTNYVNSPRSQAFLNPNGGNPNEFHWWNPGSWLGHGAGQQPGAAQAPVPYKPGQILGDMDISPQQYSTFASSVAGIERARYDQMGGSSGRFAGRYQMGADEIKETAASLGVPEPTRAQFLGDPSMQERFFEAYTDAHHRKLMRDSPKYRAMTPAERLAVDGYAHSQGVGGAEKWLETGVGTRDGWGNPGTGYSDAVRRNLARLQPPPVSSGAAGHVPAGWGAGHLGDTGHAKWPAAFMATPEGKAAFARAAAADRAGAAAGAAKYGPGRMGTYSEGEPLSVQGGTGTAGGRDATTTVKGSANLNIKLDGFPFGTKTSTSTTGDLFGAPLIEQAMPLGHGP